MNVMPFMEFAPKHNCSFLFDIININVQIFKTVQYEKLNVWIFLAIFIPSPFLTQKSKYYVL
jgi:hypothetical protein